MAAKRARAKKVHVNKYANKPRAMSRGTAKQSGDAAIDVQRTLDDIREASRHSQRRATRSIEELEAELQQQRQRPRRSDGDHPVDPRSDDEIWPEYADVR